MVKELDLKNLIAACNYWECKIYVSVDRKEFDNIDSDEFGMLFHLQAEGLKHIKESYKGVSWKYSDKWSGNDYFVVEYDVEDGSIHFLYSAFSFKTKYTLINILKSQSEFKLLGFALFDNNTEEVTDDGCYYLPEAVEADAWLNEFDEICSKNVVNSHHASLFIADEKEGEVLNLVIEINEPNDEEE